MSIRAIQDITGIHWDTIRKVQQEIMDEALSRREKELQKIGHSPKYLAVDEFAIHKGHSYATTVILETHHDLAVCYAMKEEMCRLFMLLDLFNY